MGNSFVLSSLSKTDNDLHAIDESIEKDTLHYDDLKFIDKLDFIASNYILNMNTQSLRKMYEKEYCNKMIVLTSKVIDKYFLDHEIGKNNVEILNKTDLNELDIKEPHKKQEICVEVAKFYIKVAHIFSAIVMTLNPEYIYKDSIGNIIKKNFYEKDEINNVEQKVELVKMGLCDYKINKLEKHLVSLKEPTQTDSKELLIHSEKNERNTDDESIAGEPGIPELEDLYYDIFNYKTGTFDKMSNKSREKYENDLKKFYFVYTGKKMPKSIKKFSDIKVMYQEDNMLFNDNNVNNDNDNTYENDKDLFHLYASNLKEMKKSLKDKQKKLINILNRLFEYDEKTKKIHIHPKLNKYRLQKLVEETRNIIFSLYLKCEDDYLEGMKIYEAIIESQILHTTKNQIENLEKDREKMVFV